MRKRLWGTLLALCLLASLLPTTNAESAIAGLTMEAGRSNPTPTARKLMYLIREDHGLIQKLQ